MATELSLSLAGETVQLLGARALYWPARRALLIADLHLGKADLFRRAGIGLPSGGTGDDLARLSQVLQAYPADTLWILGDVLHGSAHRAAWYRQWQGWREQHATLQIGALAGNHDRALPKANLGIELLGEKVQEGPFLLRHDPRPHPALHVLCGHLHPLARLPGMQRRWPAFWLRSGLSVLPAYSRFTAGVAPVLDDGERLVACVEGDAIALPPR
ncbi:ligase-associated DNA damage response endonuclease PdeM [Stenotrophomonas rhizophila]|uniref:ligase-associated DNA damage response endonuclease PdeM n=1 Tax=Stenotrophomonas rhizophila TaxID=216778 RepID=UPI001E607BEE|nr:ligase-associated DNA damage response endonuclease PdeM [Stenotrophomonas rhizophila]MCC7632743.1 ligase-associated DNA damage response endonuclease PdeM [Stenotrophomonas rhizophila]MCC7662532.1 ligase-associated DNA damage response endonuclease PdeM [Stenotrophomonas rhizophila]